jgi:hypothetical protein
MVQSATCNPSPIKQVAHHDCGWFRAADFIVLREPCGNLHRISFSMLGH